AGDDQLAVGEDRRGHREVHRMGAGELVAPGAELPALLAGLPVQGVDPAFHIGEVYGALGHQCRAEDAAFGGWLPQAYSPLLPIARPPLRLNGRPSEGRVAVGPADLAVGRQLVEGRVRGDGAEVDASVDDRGRGVDDADLQFGAPGRESPFLDELAGVLLAE